MATHFSVAWLFSQREFFFVTDQTPRPPKTCFEAFIFLDHAYTFTMLIYFLQYLKNLKTFNLEIFQTRDLSVPRFKLSYIYVCKYVFTFC
jgi:hypothetical protein